MLQAFELWRWRGRVFSDEFREVGVCGVIGEKIGQDVAQGGSDDEFGWAVAGPYDEQEDKANRLDLKFGHCGMLVIQAKTVNGEHWQPKTKSKRVVPISRAPREYLDRY